MKLEQLVTTYEQSKRIAELGLDNNNSFIVYHNRGLFIPSFGILPRDNYIGTVPAYTAEELGEILPESIEVFKDGTLFQYRLRIQKPSGRREIYYHDEIRDEPLLQYVPEWSDDDSEVNFILGPTLAQAMGDMLIYLLENDLLSDKNEDGTN